MSGKNKASVLLRLGCETSIRLVRTRPDATRRALRLNQQKITILNMITESEMFPLSASWLLTGLRYVTEKKFSNQKSESIPHLQVVKANQYKLKNKNDEEVKLFKVINIL